MNISLVLFWVLVISSTKMDCGEPEYGNAQSVGGVNKNSIKDINTDPIPGNSGKITVSYPGAGDVLLSWTKATDETTPSYNIAYKVYRTYDSTKVKGVGNMETYATGLDNYVNDIHYKLISGLTPNTDYYFNIIVKDWNDNKIAYKLARVNIPVTQPPAPGDSGLLISNDVTETGLILNWNTATDLVYPQSQLAYQVYYSLANNISTVTDCETNGTAYLSFAPDTNTQFITGLTASTLYYFNVVVKNPADLKSAYKSTYNTTLVDDPPFTRLETISSDYIGKTIVRLNWIYGFDDVTNQSNLQYLVYYSLANNITTVSGCEANGTASGSYQSNLKSLTVTGLTLNTNYFFNVIVKDGAGNKTAYESCTFKTSATASVPLPGNEAFLMTTDISSTGLSLSWGAATDEETAQPALEYLVYYSRYNNISTVADCEANGTASGSYAANLTYREITGLTASTPYYMNVVVKNTAGLKNVYTPTYNTTLINDPPRPIITGSIISTFTGTSTVNLQWNYACDDVSSQGTLQYLVYHSTANNISTVSGCETNGTPAGSYAVSVSSKSVTGLTSNTKYYFNVVVKDAAGNKFPYESNYFITAATDKPPVPGNNGTISTGTIANTSITISWTKATDVESRQSNLQYLVYYSLSNNLGTVAFIEANGTASGSYTKDINTQNVTGLTSGTKYYFNVIVRDEGGNKTCYQTANATTSGQSALVIGSYHQGGIVFYLNGSGGGMVCALTDQSTSASWGCYGTALTGCSGTSIGSGKVNTPAILNGCATAGIAARLCDNYTTGVYSDWFLPSSGELNAIIAKKAKIDSALLANSGTAFGTGEFWSSSQYGAAKVVSGDPTKDAITNSGTKTKSLNFKVRAVREF